MKFIFLLIITLAAGIRLQAQEVLNQDTTPLPFRGSIHYSVHYEKLFQKAQQKDLPDSAVLYIDHPWMILEFYGGLTDTLNHVYRWHAGTEQLEMVWHAQKVIWQMPERSDPAGVKIDTTAKTQVLLGHSVRKYTMSWPDGHEKSWWISDSLQLAGDWPPAGGQFMIPASGLPLEVINRSNDLVVVMRAKEIRTEPLPASKTQGFEDYKRIPFEGKSGKHPLVPKK